MRKSEEVDMALEWLFGIYGHTEEWFSVWEVWAKSNDPGFPACSLDVFATGLPRRLGNMSCVSPASYNGYLVERLGEKFRFVKPSPFSLSPDGQVLVQWFLSQREFISLRDALRRGNAPAVKTENPALTLSRSLRKIQENGGIFDGHRLESDYDAHLKVALWRFVPVHRGVPIDTTTVVV